MTEYKAKRWWPDHAPEVYDAMLELFGTLSTDTLTMILDDVNDWRGELTEIVKQAAHERTKGR